MSSSLLGLGPFPDKSKHSHPVSENRILPSRELGSRSRGRAEGMADMIAEREDKPVLMAGWRHSDSGCREQEGTCATWVRKKKQTWKQDVMS